MQTFNLDKQAIKLEKMLKVLDPSIFVAAPENGFLKAIRKNGTVCYYTTDLKHHTPWVKPLIWRNILRGVSVRREYP